MSLRPLSDVQPGQVRKKEKEKVKQQHSKKEAEYCAEFGPSSDLTHHYGIELQPQRPISPSYTNIYSVSNMTSSDPVVRVGVGVFVLKSTKEDAINPHFLMGKRLNSHGSETWALPGGHLEWGEAVEECAAREVLEETGLKLLSNTDGSPARFLTATNDIMVADRKHYITMFMVAARDDDKAEPQLMEPEKCEGWEWVSWKTLEETAWKQIAGEEPDRKLFTPMLSLFQQRPGVVPALP